MSTRWYPIYQRGNPQIRVFLPNFELKLVRPKFHQRKNVVTFICSMQMTQLDVKNYLEKIYGIPVKEVRTTITMGEFKRQQGQGCVIKDDDIKYAFVTLPENETFEFPDIFPITEGRKIDNEAQKMKESKDSHQKFLDKNKKRVGLPGWFSF